MAKQPRRKRVSIERTVDSVIVHDMKNLAFRLSMLLQNVDDNYENPIFKQSMTDILGDTIRKLNVIVKRFRENQNQLIVMLRININQILSELIEGIPARALRNIEMKTSLPDLPEIWGDPYYLRNAFQSILENALEAMPDGGRLTIKTRLAASRKPRVCLEITDTGVGMSQNFLEAKLFQPFVTTKSEGLGLGLFTCRQIIALHHGKIEAKSAPGSGTLFRIFLPVESDAG